MRKRWLVAGAGVLAAAAFAGGASAAGTTTFSLASCATNGGVRTVSAGTDVVMRTGWLAKSRGLVQAAINGSAIAMTANGVPATGRSGRPTSACSRRR